MAKLRENLVVVKVLEEHGRIGDYDRVDEFWIALRQLFADFLPDHIELPIGNLFERGPFQVDYNSYLIDIEAHILLDSVKFLPPSMLKLPDDILGYGLRVRLAQNLVELNLSSIYEENRTASLINFMEACRHELADGVLFAHEVMIKKHVDLEPPTPRDEFTQVLDGLRLIKLGCHEESSENLARDDQLVDVVQNLGIVDSLSVLAQGLLLLL